MLRQLTAVMQSRMRGSDTLARLGGDEFQIVLPQITQVEKLAGIANAIILSLAKPFLIEGERIRIEGRVFDGAGVPVRDVLVEIDSRASQLKLAELVAAEVAKAMGGSGPDAGGSFEDDPDDA